MNDEEKEFYFGEHSPEGVDYEIIEVHNPKSKVNNNCKMYLHLKHKIHFRLAHLTEKEDQFNLMHLESLSN